MCIRSARLARVSAGMKSAATTTPLLARKGPAQTATARATPRSRRAGVGMGKNLTTEHQATANSATSTAALRLGR